MTKQLALDQVARNGGHVDGDERPATAFAIIMQRAGDQLLASTGLARDHDREIGLHEARERAVDLLHGRRTPDQRHALELLDLLLGCAGAWLAHRATHDIDEFLQVEGLGQIIIGTALGRLDSRHERVLRAHHDDRQVGAQLLDARQKFESVLVRHDDVGDDEIAFPRLHPTPERSGCPRDANFVSGPCQRLAEHGSDRSIVVGNEDVSSRHYTRLLKPHAGDGSAANPSWAVSFRPGPAIGRNEHGKQDPEGGPARVRLAFDDATVITNDLGNKCKTEASS